MKITGSCSIHLSFQSFSVSRGYIIQTFFNDLIRSSCKPRSKLKVVTRNIFLFFSICFMRLMKEGKMLSGDLIIDGKRKRKKNFFFCWKFQFFLFNPWATFPHTYTLHLNQDINFFSSLDVFISSNILKRIFFLSHDLLFDFCA